MDSGLLNMDWQGVLAGSCRKKQCLLAFVSARSYRKNHESKLKESSLSGGRDG
jgi:hypothetical protein